MRLLRSRTGNVLPITAAMLIPLLGVVGGGVDMARLYLVKSRMQQACDAGALAGRKAMGTGNWTAGGPTTSEGRALALFDGNFKDGDYGTGTRTRSYSESNGTVTGTATTTVPMTVMRALGFSQKSITVNCTAKMEIPNTDVMFVLDVTGSMAWTNTGDTDTKINGLKRAVKCFYEALLKVNTTEVCGSDPTATTYSGQAQIRLGFVPYSVNVNVGKLLPNSFLADSWDYQSREPDGPLQDVWAWTLGSATTNYGSASPSSPSSYYQNSANYNTFSGIGTTGTVTLTTLSGVSNFPREQTSGTTSTSCTAFNNTYGNIVGYTMSTTWGSTTWTSTTNDPPVYPATSQDKSGTQVGDAAVQGYRYSRFKQSGKTSCWLTRANAKSTFDQTRSASFSAPITWTQHQNTFANWVYRKRSLTVSGLKAGGSTWNNSVSLPLSSTTASVKLSGSNSTTTINILANMDVDWNGCVEERHTFQSTNSSTIATDWATIPSDALDMDIDTVPSGSTAFNSYWGPLLPNATWSRTSGGNRTLADTTSGSQAPNVCPAEARKLQEWTTPAPFVSYVDSLSPTGNTYHDIGMIWGARFISPTGIFASENAATLTGQPIQRHIIFMTDGDTQTSISNYAAYGMTWWNRLETSFAPTTTDTDDLVNARLTALCTAIRNRNITLWVVSFGSGVSSAAQTRLSACATPGKFFSAANSATLLSQFRQIAAEISDLRLTS